MDRIPESIQKIIEDYITKLGQIIPIYKVVISGSYANGNYHKYSDVDIAIFSEYFKNMGRLEGLHFLLLRAMDYEIDLEPQPFTIEEYNHPVGLVSEILKTGIDYEIPISA